MSSKSRRPIVKLVAVSFIGGNWIPLPKSKSSKRARRRQKEK